MNPAFNAFKFFKKHSLIMNATAKCVPVGECGIFSVNTIYTKCNY